MSSQLLSLCHPHPRRDSQQLETEAGTWKGRVEAGDFSHLAASLTPRTPPPLLPAAHQPRTELCTFWNWAVAASTDAREEGVKNIFHLSAALYRVYV